MTPVLAQRLRTDRSFERIYRRHLGDVYRYTLAVLRNPSDAEDVTQTTFLNAYRAYQRGERPRNPQNWLIAIAHNVCRQRFRQSARRPEEVAFDDAIGDLVPDDDDGPSVKDIQRALGHLAFNQRAALVMRELEGRSYAEIADVLGLSVSAVETLIFRARRALREQLEGSLTCGESERAISRQLDGRLSRADRASLRAHLRECNECQRFARSQRAQRTAIKALAAVPIPTSLTTIFGGGAAAAGGGLGVKAAAVVAAGSVAAGIGYEGAKRADVLGEERSAAGAAARQQPVVPPLTPARVELPPNAGRPAEKPAAAQATRERPARSRARAVPSSARKPEAQAPPEHAVARGHERGAERTPPKAKRKKAKPVAADVVRTRSKASLPAPRRIRPQRPKPLQPAAPAVEPATGKRPPPHPLPPAAGKRATR